MSGPYISASAALLGALAAIITYYDTRYRRIPNPFVLATLLAGLWLNAQRAGLAGLEHSLTGCALAFGLMLLLHVFGALGAGDVKLFAAIGAVLGPALVPTTFLVVVLTGGVLAVVTMVRAGLVRTTLLRVAHIFLGLLPGWELPRFAVPAERRHTIPYGVAITFGSLLSLLLFRA